MKENKSKQIRLTKKWLEERELREGRSDVEKLKFIRRNREKFSDAQLAEMFKRLKKK